MNGWQTYRLEDFIPFTPEVYWRLLERINEAFWPLHVLAVAIGLAARPARQPTHGWTQQRLEQATPDQLEDWSFAILVADSLEDLLGEL